MVGADSLAFGRGSKGGREGKLCGRKKRRLRCALIAGCWFREAGWGPVGSRDFCDYLGVCVWLSLVGPQLAEGAKIRGSWQ